MNHTRTLPYIIQASNKEKRVKDRKIPYTIMQTMKSANMPINMYRVALQWTKMNPTYDYEFFDDKRCREFIKEHYEPDVIIAFDMLNVGAAKADLFRWCYLYIRGGIYLDMDMQCRRGFGKDILDRFIVSNSDKLVFYVL